GADAGNEVGGPAGGKRHDQRDQTFGIGRLRERASKRPSDNHGRKRVPATHPRGPSGHAQSHLVASVPYPPRAHCGAAIRTGRTTGWRSAIPCHCVMDTYPAVSGKPTGAIGKGRILQWLTAT